MKMTQDLDKHLEEIKIIFKNFIEENKLDAAYIIVDDFIEIRFIKEELELHYPWDETMTIEQVSRLRGDIFRKIREYLMQHNIDEELHIKSENPENIFRQSSIDFCFLVSSGLFL